MSVSGEHRPASRAIVSRMPNRPLPSGMSGSDWTLLLLLALIWGGSFVFNRIALEGLPVLTVVLGRVGLAAIALQLAARLRGSWPARAPWRAFLAMGTLNNLLPFMLIVAGQRQIGAGLAAVLNATTPLFSAVLAATMLRDPAERLTPRRIGGIVLGVLGVAVLVGPDMVGPRPSGAAYWSCLAVLGAALSYGLAGIYGRRFGAMGITPLAAAAGQTSAAALLALPLALLIDRPWRLDMPGAAVWVALLGLALPCTALAYILFFRILASAGPVAAALVTILIPPSAAMLAALVSQEAFGPRKLAGFALIAAALLTLDARAARAVASVLGLRRLRAARTR
jgi:drug/metabolite transporter (DMT)-like permease